MQRFHIYWLLCGLVMTMVNIWKPIHLDDVIWVHFARHIAEAPLKPFDFEMPWGYGCIPAIEMWSPPVLPYWWGAGVALFGEWPAFWKAWFLPFNLLFSASAFALALRFARPFAIPVGIALVLAPVVLPATNLMQDIPAASLVLASLATLLAACDRDRLSMALLAGVLLGLACLTKWSALSGFGVIGLACLLFAPSWRWWVLVPGLAAIIFVGWEAYLLVDHGQSNFLLSVSGHGAPDATRIKGMVLALLTYVGALAPFIAIVGWSGVMPRLSLAVICVLIGVFLALVLLPETLPIKNPLSGREVRLDTPLLAGLGLLVWSAVLAALIIAASHARQTRHVDRALVFLGVWVLIELMGYFLLSPFPAARRLITLLVAVSLLTVAAEGHRLEPGKVRLASAIQVVVALVFVVVDFADATRIRQAAEQVMTDQLDNAAGSTIWVKGQFGFDYYTARNGGRTPCNGDILQPGDLLVLHVAEEDVDARASKIANLEGSGAIFRTRDMVQPPLLPLTTMGFGYYIGRRPIEGAHGALQNLAVFQINETLPWSRFVPESAR